MFRRTTLIWAAALALIGGCATHWDVESFEAPDANVASRQTFFWKGGEFATPSSTDAQLVESATAQLRTTVGEALTRRGYREVDTAAAADMLVSFQVAGTQRSVLADDRRVGAPSATQVLRPGGFQPPPASTVPSEQRVRDGTVLFFIDDRATGSLLWRGGVTAETRVGSTAQGVRMLNQMAREIMLEVPARAGAGQ